MVYFSYDNYISSFSNPLPLMAEIIISVNVDNDGRPLKIRLHFSIEYTDHI